MGENLLDHHGILNGGDNPERAATDRAGLDVDTEDAHQALCPGHRGAAFGRRGLLAVIGGLAFVASASLGRCHQGAVLTVRRKHAMEPREVDSGLRHQRGQPGNEIQRLKDDVRSAS